MSITVIPRTKASTSHWSGGTTTEFYIAPAGSAYKERNFTLRISSATVDLPESDFTMLPDYNRIIAPLTGGFTLTYQEVPGRSDTLAPLEDAFFDGGWHTHSVGKAVDFNLMYRKDTTATYEKLTESRTLVPAAYRFVYTPIVPVETLKDSTLDGIALEPDTLYVIPEEDGDVELKLGKEAVVIYLIVKE